jgi:hypothetical protein
MLIDGFSKPVIEAACMFYGLTLRSSALASQSQEDWFMHIQHSGKFHCGEARCDAYRIAD